MSEELAKKLQSEEENKGNQFEPRYWVFTNISPSPEVNQEFYEKMPPEGRACIWKC